MDHLEVSAADPTSLSLLQKGGVLYAPGGQPLGEEGEERSDAGTVHSKCSRTGSAYPVAVGHRDSIQQEMIKQYRSDLLGEPCLFAEGARSTFFWQKKVLFFFVKKILFLQKNTFFLQKKSTFFV